MWLATSPDRQKYPNRPRHEFSSGGDFPGDYFLSMGLENRLIEAKHIHRIDPVTESCRICGIDEVSLFAEAFGLTQDYPPKNENRTIDPVIGYDRFGG
jgi:hypothetical protein